MKECCVYEYELDEWNIIFWIMYCFFFYGMDYVIFFFFFFQAEDGIRDGRVTGVQTCALPIFTPLADPSGQPPSDQDEHDQEQDDERRHQERDEAHRQ